MDPSMFDGFDKVFGVLFWLAMTGLPALVGGGIWFIVWLFTHVHFS